MTTLSNVELFNVFSLALFNKLYESFPTPVDIDYSAIAADLLPDEVDADDADRILKVAYHAVQWLEEEDFIRIGDQTMDGGFHQVVLTGRGLAVLDSVPDGQEGSGSVASQLGDLVEEAGKDLAKEEVKKAIKNAMAFIVRTAAALAISSAS